VDAGLERDVERRALGLAPGPKKGHGFSMRPAGGLVMAPADEDSVLHQDGADAGVGEVRPADLAARPRAISM